MHEAKEGIRLLHEFSFAAIFVWKRWNAFYCFVFYSRPYWLSLYMRCFMRCFIQILSGWMWNVVFYNGQQAHYSRPPQIKTIATTGGLHVTFKFILRRTETLFVYPQNSKAFVHSSLRLLLNLPTHNSSPSTNSIFSFATSSSSFHCKSWYTSSVCLSVSPSLYQCFQIMSSSSFKSSYYAVHLLFAPTPLNPPSRSFSRFDG